MKTNNGQGNRYNERRPVIILDASIESIDICCPCCAHIFKVVKYEDYCPHCGQLLDWGKVEQV